ncbi:Desmethylyatein synthase [Linum grandiflorum]
MDAQMNISLNHFWQTLQYDSQLLLLLSLILLVPCFYLVTCYNSPKLNLPPSPPKLPIIGNLHQLSTLLHRSLHSLSLKFGPLMLIHMGKAPTLVVSSVDTAREIMKNHDVSFSSRPQTRATNSLFSGCTDVAFSPYSEYWRAVKKICVQQLLSQRRVQEFQFVREEEVAAVVQMIRANNNSVVDLSEILLTLSNNIVSRSALGKVYELGGSCEEDDTLGRLSRKAIDLIGTFCFKDMFRFMGWMDYLTGLVPSLRKTSKALHDVLDQVIEEHVQAPGNKRDLVDILLQLQRDGMLEIELSRDNLRAILMDMFVGGTDTTSAVMEWAMSQLVKNPPVMKKAQEEIRNVVGTKHKISEAELNQMPYLKDILKETLRLHAPAMIARETSEAVNLQGYDIPSKTRVLVNAWAIQRDPTTWGDNAEEFIPERFAGNSTVDFKGQHSEFIPFGFGRRICPGMGFAVAEAELVLANLLCWFDWRVADGEIAEDLDLRESNALIVHKMKPLVLIPVVYYYQP